MATNLEHYALSGSDLHEPKGVPASTADLVYSSDGASSGDWKNYPIQVMFTEIANHTTAATYYFVIPFAGDITKIETINHAAFSTADTTVDFYVEASGTSMGTITITQSGSGAADIDSTSPSSNNTFTAGQALRIVTAGGSTGTSKLGITITFTRSS